MNRRLAFRSGGMLLDFKAELSRLSSSLMEFLFPRLCAGCRVEWLTCAEGYWCRKCLEELPWIRSPLCTCCGRPFHQDVSSANHLCGDCIVAPPPFDFARSATLHYGAVRDRIHSLKFGAQLHWVPALVQLMTHALETDDGLLPASRDFSMILPVPLHLKRLRQRGFNQSGLLARFLGLKLGVEVHYDVIVRIHWTEPQTRLQRSERLTNLKDAFLVLNPAILKGRSVLLVDDVFTTGATISECAQVLKRSGAESVGAVTVSRSIPGWHQDPILLS